MLTPCFHVFALKLNSGVIQRSLAQEPSQSMQESPGACTAVLPSLNSLSGHLFKMQASYATSFIDICEADALD